MKALMFGGAFNPPTCAHIQLAEYVKDQLQFDVVIFVPTKMTYISDIQHKDYVFSNEERYDMLCDIARDKDWMIVSDYELTESVQPRTFQTLKHLKKNGYDVSLLFGSDKLVELETGWLHVEDIAKEFGIVCMQRNHDDCQLLLQTDPFLKTIEPYVRLVDTPDTFQMISSTKIRQLLKDGKYDEANQYLPKEIRINR